MAVAAEREKRSGLTFARLRELVHYRPETGEMVSRVDRGRRRAGDPIGWLSNGYVRARIEGEEFAVHRLIIFYMTGVWPPEEVDHINGDRADNRWANLRPCSPTVNMQNRIRPRPRNQARLLGAFPHGDGRWRSQIMAFGQRHDLGMFATAADAHAAYLAAKRVLHPGWAPTD